MGQVPFRTCFLLQRPAARRPTTFCPTGDGGPGLSGRSSVSRPLTQLVLTHHYTTLLNSCQPFFADYMKVLNRANYGIRIKPGSDGKGVVAKNNIICNNRKYGIFGDVVSRYNDLSTC